MALLLDDCTAGEPIPELAHQGLQQLIELKVAAVLGAERQARCEERHGYRNGYWSRLLTIQAEGIDLRIPKLRCRSYILSILELRPRVDQPLYPVVMEASGYACLYLDTTDTSTAGCGPRSRGQRIRGLLERPHRFG